MKVTDYIAKKLKSEGITAVFGFQGSNVTHLINSIAGSGDIRYVQNHHEQASAFAANAYSVVSGKLGCAVTSGGPGAINLISGIANAWLDSVPVVFLTGQLNSKALRTVKDIRQNGFQEFDIAGTVGGFTKYAVTVLDAEDIRFQLEKALFLAKNGRPGPVLLDIPHNIQSADIDLKSIAVFAAGTEYDHAQILPSEVNEVFDVLKTANRPLLLLGGGARKLKNDPALSELIQRFDLAAVASLNGLDILPHDDKRFYGFIGSYGNRYANLAVRECDLLIALGSRLDTRQTGEFPFEFAKNAKIVHIDIDRNELKNKTFPHISICGDCGDFIKALSKISVSYSNSNPAWHCTLEKLKTVYPPFSDDDPKTLPNAVIRAASMAMAGSDIIIGDVGQNQMWTAQSVYLRDNMRLLNSGGLGAMGFSLPAAIGAVYASNTKALAITGDGGLQMNLQELGTVAREKLPVKILLMNNQSLGLIRTYQAIVFKNAVGSVEGFGSPDYRLLSESYGIPYAAITSADEVAGIEPLLKNDSPLFVEMKLSADTEVHPEPAYMQPVHVQSPLIQQKD